VSKQWKIEGVFTAMVTPFTTEGEIDYLSMTKVIEFHIGAGVSGLYVLGTMGEWPLIHKEQRKAILEFVLRQVKGRVPVMAHIGALPVRDACELATHAEAVGAAAISSIPPYFYPFAADDIESYFSALFSSVSEYMPVLLYNIPSYARNVIPAELVKKLRDKYPNMQGIKESQGDLGKLKEYIEAVGEDGTVLVGADELDLAALQAGCKGIISGLANVLPELYVGLVSAVKKGKMENANRLQELINQFLASNRARIPLIKYGLKIRGIPAGYANKPYAGVSEHDAEFEKETIFRILEEIKGMDL
jgi:N-acetylneuraminate lyase